MTPLRELAAELGVEREWLDVNGAAHVVSDDTLVQLCAALRPGFARCEDAADALASLRADGVAAAVEPVTVVWDDDPARVLLHRPASSIDPSTSITIKFAGGDEHTVTTADYSVHGLPDQHRCVVEFPGRFPIGAHELAVMGLHLDARGHLLVAPRRPRPTAATHRWGLFAPVYALHDRVRPDAGDFGTLARFANWAAARGAEVVGTLPILATFVGHGAEPCDPSPYAPVTRRFWNETYLDPRELDPALHVTAAMPPGAATDLVARAARMRDAVEPLVEAAARQPEFYAWIAAQPSAREYAAFRAAREQSGARGARYHEVVQWWCDLQLSALARTMHARDQALYLDFPLGEHRDGFDVAQHPALFVRDASVGAPPDAFFASGQNWGFPPVHSLEARREGYATLRASLDAHFRFARILRIDHVMGLDRLWFVPSGASAADGAYVRYAGSEQWAALCIAAAQHDGTIVGENLGTVPTITERELEEHGALGMWVLPFETSVTEPLVLPAAQQLACLDTHDTPPFAAWWREQPASHREAVAAVVRADGMLADDSDPDDAAMLGALLAWLGASDASVVLASLEDLWLETEPQNRPGTPSDQNFRGRGRHGIDEIDTEIDGMLRALDNARRRSHMTSPHQ
jgi:4-alpha-glucanotransferase